MKSGFVAIVGRTGVGKSTLLNEIVQKKVSITSKHSNTTRFAVKGILNRADAQVIFVDTPGFHRPKTRLGERLNSVAGDFLGGVDCVLFVIDATALIGKGDSALAKRVPANSICVVNKIDRAKPGEIVSQLLAASKFNFPEYFPVSSKTGQGVDELVDELVRRLPNGPRLYPVKMVTDLDIGTRVGELVREQLLEMVRDELPHSLACQVTEWDGSYIRCDIFVERESQKPIVMGAGAQNLKLVGTKVREVLEDELGQSIFLDLRVKIAKDWQSSDRLIDSIGYGVGDEY